MLLPRRLLPLLALLPAGCNALDDTAPATASRGEARPAASPTDPGFGSLGDLTYRAVDRILALAPGLPPGTPLVVASLSDVRDLDRSSAFGNITADMIRSRLAQRGMLVSELRMRAAMRVDPRQGEIMLTRDPRAFAGAPNAAGIMTGTYAAGSRHVWVSLKLLARGDGRVLAGADFAVPRYYDVDALLRPEEPARVATRR